MTAEDWSRVPAEDEDAPIDVPQRERPPGLDLLSQVAIRDAELRGDELPDELGHWSQISGPGWRP